MRLLSTTALFLSISHLIASASIPQSSNPDLIAREASAKLLTHSKLDIRSLSALTKRKGGGGGKGGSGGGSSSSGGSSSGGSRSGGSSGSGGSSSSGSGRSFSPSSNAGGRTVSGSGAKPGYGGYYAGGARVPYTSGRPSPSRGFAPLFLPIAAFAFFPGIWLYGSLYSYPFGSPYWYYDRENRNRTVDVTCLCQQYSVCGCDDDGNSSYIQALIGNGTDRPVNTSQVVILPVLKNGTQRAYVNGTLPNGTTAAGGTDPSSDSQATSAAVRFAVNYGGYWIMAMTVIGTVLAL
jgi:hypothetical protein